jgi:spoIIIJ-associated protein
MEWVETTGRTIEAALDAALDELGVDENDVEYEVLQEPKTGWFARFGGGEARVRARVKPISREKPGERQRRNRRGSSARSRSDAPAGDAVATDSGAGTRPGGGSPPPRSRRRSGGGGARNAGGAGNGNGSGKSTGNGDAPKKSSQRATTSARTQPRREVEGNTVEATERDVPIEEQAQAAEDFTRGLVDAFDLGAQVDTVIDDDTVLIEVTGENLGLLVGPRGATLTAIEELVRTVVQRQTDGHGARIHVDVAGYRAKRRDALEEFTRALAAEVLESGRPKRLEPMSASDRKVVHDTAAEIEGVATESEGEDPRRRVVLRPA